VALYGVVLLFAAIAYFILAHVLISLHGKTSMIGKALGRDFKGKISIVVYLAGIPLAFVRPWMACLFYVAVTVMWLVPDPRIEKKIVE
jgi:uncharacterized membrane protein